MFIFACVLGAILLSTCFVKSLRNTHRTHTNYYWLVYWLALFDVQISLILNIQSISVCENFSLLNEVKCHVLKIIVH